MREIVVLSGKGGTGKTSLVASFAVLARNAVLVDCDVDAADLHLLLEPQVEAVNEFWSGQTAFIRREKCIQCDLCQTLCRFRAISDYQVDRISCEGCAFCSRICPVDAVEMKQKLAGHWFVSETRYGYLVHAKLAVAQENSGKLVAAIRKEAHTIAVRNNHGLIISDGPPGIGCPVISSLSGADLAVLVTEPTLSGIFDLKRVLEVCQHFNVPAMICINKYDINPENTEQILRFCEEKGIEVAAKIPFDSAVTQAIIKGFPVIEFYRGKVSSEIERLWSIILAKLQSLPA
ncbi:MAG: ATP-binding protein [Dehalococcoidales bacterium]|jgi:MinD superfamily P-loop ATPase|nr:ATP-binding protein [Dehalococcoidales bacterium]